MHRGYALISLSRKYGPIIVRENWFAESVVASDALVPAVYMQCRQRDLIIGFVRRDFETKVIDLSKTEEELTAEMEKNTVYEVRRAHKDGVAVIESEDWDGFVHRYNIFAAHKNLRPISRLLINRFQPFLRLVTAKCEGEILADHVYLIDRDAARCRLLYSAGCHRDDADSKWRASVGRANRSLHWEAIKLFKRDGYSLYDLGGYAKNTSDPVMIGINKFKDSFGGQIVEESHYLSLPLVALQVAKKLFKH